jgi:hypothetical protein
MNLFSKNLVKNQYFLYYSGLIYRGYNISYNISDNFPIYRGIMLNYDNSSISKDYFAIFYEYSSEKFYLLNKLLIDWTKNHYNESNQLLIINSWNNWNEGSYLEPDEKNRYAKLLAAARADVRMAEDKLRQSVNAYNMVANDAAKKTGETYTSLEFKGVAAVAPTASNKYAFTKEADEKALDKAATDLANIIFQTLGI